MPVLSYIRSVIREKVKSIRRSSQWDEVRDAYLENNSCCESCGSKKKLQVHHVKPFHLYPELELDSSNLITLCMDENDCHLNIGHGDNWRCYNPNVRGDAGRFLTSPQDRKQIILEAKKNRLT